MILWTHWTNGSKTRCRKASSWITSNRLDRSSTATSFNLAGGGDPRCVRAAQVQPEILAALNAQPIAGRVSTAKEDRPGHEPVVTLTEGLWRSQFGSDAAIVGRTRQLDAEPDTVVGVPPAALRLRLDFASRTFTPIWVRLALGPNDPQQRGNHGLNALGRLRPGIALPQAQAEIDAIMRGFLQRDANNDDKDFGLTLVAAPREVFGDVRPADVLRMVRAGDHAVDADRCRASARPPSSANGSMLSRRSDVESASTCCVKEDGWQRPASPSAPTLNADLKSGPT